MIDEARPYAEYKSTEVPWLGDIPAHWEVRPLRTLLKQRSEKNRPLKTRQILSLSIAHGVTLYSHEGRGGNKSKSDLTAYKIARKGDIVMNSMNVVVGAVGLSKYTGAISPVYYALYPLSDNVDIHYYDTVFSNHTFQRYLLIYGKGILIKEGDSGKLNTIRMKISSDDLKTIPLPFPTVEEQTAIARFLNWKNVQINRFIRNRRRLIEVLNEQKQAIINQAVTRGLDPNAPLKPSGIDWLGDIPEHWNVFPIKRLFSHMDYGISDSSKDEGRYLVLTMGNIRNGAVTVGNCGRVAQVDPLLVLDRHDLLFNRTNSLELVGKVGIFEGNRQDEVTFASYLVRMRVNARTLPQYANYLLNSPGVLRVARLNAIPSLHQANLNPTRYGRLPVPLPPKAEQAIILEYIADRCGVLDDAMVRTQREIDLIREYRTRLIADVVTGKVDVRDLAPADSLPADEQIDEAIDAEVMIDDDEPAMATDDGEDD